MIILQKIKTRIIFYLLAIKEGTSYDKLCSGDLYLSNQIAADQILKVKTKLNSCNLETIMYLDPAHRFAATEQTFYFY